MIENNPPSNLPANAATQDPVEKIRTGVSTGFVVLISGVISIASSYLTWCAVRAFPPEPPAQVVVVDMARLAVAKAFSSAETGEMAQASAQKFLRDIDKVTENYTKSGVLVINSQAAFNRPGTVDVTAAYAKLLGVDLSKKAQ